MRDSLCQSIHLFMRPCYHVSWNVTRNIGPALVFRPFFLSFWHGNVIIFVGRVCDEQEQWVRESMLNIIGWTWLNHATFSTKTVHIIVTSWHLKTWTKFRAVVWDPPSASPSTSKQSCFFSILFLDVSLLRQWQRYGIRKNGQHVARLRVSGAGANDWEDIAIGPGDCPQDVHDSADSAVDNGGQA